MDLEVVVEGVSDVSVANEIKRKIQQVCKEMEGSGDWSIIVSPSERRGEWDLGARGPSGRHFASFLILSALTKRLPGLVAERFRAFLRARAVLTST